MGAVKWSLVQDSNPHDGGRNTASCTLDERGESGAACRVRSRIRGLRTPRLVHLAERRGKWSSHEDLPLDLRVRTALSCLVGRWDGKRIAPAPVDASLGHRTLDSHRIRRVGQVKATLFGSKTDDQRFHGAKLGRTTGSAPALQASQARVRSTTLRAP